MMTSFGSGIKLTPLQLAALVGAMANGGTLYFLQHPQSQDEIDRFEPKVKRQLNIAQWIPDVKSGMEGAVEYGTARRANYNSNEPIFGKTGTCSDEDSPGIHLGWFGSFNEANNKKLVVVVLLTGGRPINGPVASGIAGAVYRNLSEEGYFGSQAVAGLPLSLVASQSCCQ
jgi:cell division protein FtsI/penicillin-binding protein 2